MHSVLAGDAVVHGDAAEEAALPSVDAERAVGTRIVKQVSRHHLKNAGTQRHL